MLQREGERAVRSAVYSDDDCRDDGDCDTQKYERDYSDVAGFILVYSVTDRNSYQYVANMLSCLQRNDNYSSTAVILAANKTDLVRKRQVDNRGNDNKPAMIAIF